MKLMELVVNKNNTVVFSRKTGRVPGNTGTLFGVPSTMLEYSGGISKVIIIDNDLLIKWKSFEVIQDD